MSDQRTVKIGDLEAVPSEADRFVVRETAQDLVLGDVRIADDGRFEARRADGYFAGAFKTLAEAMRTLAGDR
ncbi:hypothetical protein NCCP1664_15750 [Zafaria cholistanensis]|uniref:Uncharacterized protein n=1 Tax=Zafaria cholistanensis TaxID=1682741 RepID=A0A5A7NQT7_9MICC|nr:hypothetical protein [Zafaria cholistanensis]GER23079.1 hypothetical protein NCCP1664_15750 [Zafaria cholistanensis]